MYLHEKPLPRMKISDITRNLLIASYLPGIGKSTLWRIASTPDFARANLESLPDYFPELIELKKKSAKYDLAIKRAEEQILFTEKHGCALIGYWDRDYPRTLKNAPLSPALFWFKGNVDSLNKPQVAVIGTRHPTNAGRIVAERVTTALVAGGLSIVSGLALGVDTIAHESAVKNKGTTIAIMAGGLDSIAPKTNTALAANIIEVGGGLLSEFPIGSTAFPANFVTRDSTQAALSTALFLIQSDIRGGSLYASRAIARLRRKLYVTAPIQRDINNNEPKISANVLFANGDISKVIEAMDFPADIASHFAILHGKEQYAEIVRQICEQWKQLALQPHRRIDPI